MKSSLLGPLVLLVLCSAIASGQTTTGSKYFKPFYFGLNWDEAQQFCKRYYTDLATISTWSEADGLYLKNYLVWVGLQNYGYGWIWVDGSYYSGWVENQQEWGTCAAVRFLNKTLYATNCGYSLMFVCRRGGDYTFVNEAMGWYDARNYCSKNGKYLATFSSGDVDEIFTEKDFPVWVGRRKQGESFQWSTGSSTYENWTADGQSHDCVAVSSLTKQMSTTDCHVRLPFVCMWDGGPNVLVVKENKTWEAALAHCRGLTTSGLRFDLVSVQPGDDYMKSKALQADTQQVWIGLRFLGDEWLWVNGANTSNAGLPQCPMQGQRCGALSNSGSVETRDCSEKNNFLCYSFGP